jgi:hypothetical protein
MRTVLIYAALLGVRAAPMDDHLESMSAKLDASVTNEEAVATKEEQDEEKVDDVGMLVADLACDDPMTAVMAQSFMDMNEGMDSADPMPMSFFIEEADGKLPPHDDEENGNDFKAENNTVTAERTVSGTPRGSHNKGCWFKMPAGCPRHNYYSRSVWHWDSYGNARGARNSKSVCDARAGNINSWCGFSYTSVQTYFVGNSPPPPPPPRYYYPTPSPPPTPPQSNYRCINGCLNNRGVVKTSWYCSTYKSYCYGCKGCGGAPSSSSSSGSSYRSSTPTVSGGNPTCWRGRRSRGCSDLAKSGYVHGTYSNGQYYCGGYNCMLGNKAQYAQYVRQNGIDSRCPDTCASYFCC